MNKNELRAEIIRYGDTYSSLANALGISLTALSYKMNAKVNGFTQKEIQMIVDRYNLSAEAIKRIFFTHEMSRTDEYTEIVEDISTVQT